MPDPNITYREGYKALTRELGRLPTMRDKGLLALHEAYKKAWAPAEETVLPPSHAAAGRPEPTGFSRQPAPQAQAIGEDARTREPVPDLMAALEASLAPFKATREATGGPRINAEGAEHRSEPAPPENKPGLPDGLIEGDRGPGGGLMCRCQACGQLWERAKARGRPAYTCGGCR